MFRNVDVNRIYRLNLLFTGFLLFFLSEIHAQLIVEVTNIKEIKGSINIGLYTDEETFMDYNLQFRKVRKPVTSDTMLLVFDDIPAGWYAFSVLHDLNLDAKMEHNWFGYPQEPYALSNNYRPLFRKPKFKETRFYYDGTRLLLHIRLIQ